MATGTIIPSPIFTGIDTNGDPVNGGKLHTYVAGTTTAQTTYSDVNLTVANANPVVLDSAGRATVFVSGGSSFKYVLTDSDDVTLWTADNIGAVPKSTATLDVTVTAGEDLTALDCVYISQGDGSKTAGRAYKTDADQTYSSSLAINLGLTPAAISEGETGSIRVGGSLGGYTGLTAGSTQYVSATAGALTESAPTNVQIVGQATSTTEVMMAATISQLDASKITSGRLDNARLPTNIDVAGTLDVTGATTLDSTLGATGATTLSSTLGVTGATTLSSTLGVTGATTLSSTLGVTGATTLSSTLGVTGATSLSSTLAVGDDLAVDTDTLFVDVSEGRVGINKSDPAAEFEVTSDSSTMIRVTSTLDTDTGFELYNSTGRVWEIVNDVSGAASVDAFVLKPSGSLKFTFEQSGNLTITGALSKGSGSFRIPHPLPAKNETHQLVHSFIEGPQCDLIYRGSATLVAGSATVNLDTASHMTEGTWVLLCRSEQCFTSNETGWASVRGSVSGNILTIECEDATSTDTISWMVVAERHDAHILETSWTDADGHVIVEPETL
jgi:hypothetical protein